ncbi:MAG: aminotransferase class IV [Gammaproteobacteria bacterium]|nr:aminotransferase class IV [Gammaproteobacteria bacterium]
MSERIVYLNGQFVEESNARVSILDRGFLYGDSVYDSSRTFAGTPWRMRAHIDRLYLSCRYARLDPGMSADEMESVSNELVARNRAVHADNEFRINHWITRGGGISVDPDLSPSAHTVCIFTLPMDYQRFAHGYAEGVPSVVTSVRRTPPECVEPRAKIGGKMNHIQAEFEAKQANAWGIMLDTHGFVAEGPSYNCFFVRNGELLTSNPTNCLVGVNRTYIIELAERLGIPVRETNLTHYDLLTADEAFHSGNSICLLPVRSIDGVKMADGAPGPISERLTRAWMEEVGFDWREHALASLNRV